MTPYALETTATVRRVLTEPPPRGMPDAIAAAVYEFITGALLENPRRVGKRLLPPRDGQWSARRGTYRVVYEIDDERQVVVIVAVGHRADVYRR